MIQTSQSHHINAALTIYYLIHDRSGINVTQKNKLWTQWIWETVQIYSHQQRVTIWVGWRCKPFDACQFIDRLSYGTGHTNEVGEPSVKGATFDLINENRPRVWIIPLLLLNPGQRFSCSKLCT